MALDRLTKVDGGGISTTSDYRVGVITATKFVGPVEGSLTGAINATSANFSGNVTIGGTLTYEDVTNIDSIGLGTFRNGIHVKTGTATTALVVEGDGRVTGILTIGTSSLTLDGTNNLVNVGTALTLGHTQGVQFHTQNLHSQGFEVNNINASGIITAAQFSGDGSNLANLPAGLGTALSSTQSSPLNKIYYTNSVLPIDTTTTVDPPASASAAYTQYTDISIATGADLIISDGDDLIPDVLGLRPDGTLGGGSLGRIRVDKLVGKNANSAVNVEKGLVITGITTINGTLDADQINCSGIVTATAFIPTSGQLSHRNRIVNGALQIWQRGTSINSQGNGQNDYTADRFAIGHNNSHMAAVTQQDGTGTNAGFRYCARIQRDSGNSQTDQMRFHTALETHDVVPLRGNVLTISYYARKGANYSEANSKITGVRIATGENTDGDPNAYSGGHWTNSATLLTGTPTLTTSWQRFSHTTSAVPSGANSMIIEFRHTPVGTAGANDWYEITGVQLEIGNTATPFEHRSIGEELIRCQRYFQFIEYAHAIARSSTNTGGVSAQFACEMRAAPTIGTMNISTRATNVGLNLQGDGSVNTTQSSGNQGTSYSSQRSMYLYDMSGFSGMTAGRSYIVAVPANNAVVFTADAEL